MTTIGAVPAPTEVEEGIPGSKSLSFADLLSRYQTELYRLARCLTFDRTAADDLYLQTLRTAYIAFDRLDEASNHRVWLFAIATNAFLRNPACARREGSRVEERVAMNATRSAGHAACADGRELQCEVAAFVAALPCTQRAALILRLNHNLGYAEIAARLRCSTGEARATVYEVLRSLLEHVGDRL